MPVISHLKYLQSYEILKCVLTLIFNLVVITITAGSLKTNILVNRRKHLN